VQRMNASYLLMARVLGERKKTAVMNDKQWVAANKHVLKPEHMRNAWHSGNKVTHDNANNPQQELTPERELWAAVIRQAMTDAVSTKAEVQATCMDRGCGRTDHTVQQCARDWLEQEGWAYWAEMCGLEADEMRRQFDAGASAVGGRFASRNKQARRIRA
jgi:hypothetical protein